MFYTTNMMTELDMEDNFLTNLEFIIVGLVDGTMKYTGNIQHKLFTMTTYSEQIAKKNYLN